MALMNLANMLKSIGGNLQSLPTKTAGLSPLIDGNDMNAVQGDMGGRRNIISRSQRKFKLSALKKKKKKKGKLEKVVKPKPDQIQPMPNQIPDQHHGGLQGFNTDNIQGRYLV